MHFFIDHTALTTVQDPTLAFGPSGQNPAAKAAKYNLTSRFNLASSTKAFACQTGMLVLQKSAIIDGSGNPQLNAIIKPIDTLFASGNKVAYYIYRGISFNGLISGNNIAGYNSGNNNLIARIYSVDTTKTYDRNILGYDDSIADTAHIDTIFYNTDGTCPVLIKEGEWFGNFSPGIAGFEVVTEPDKLNISLSMVRAGNTTVDVSLLIDEFAIRNAREQILGFMDPAALFGLHFDAGISVTTATGTSTLKGSDLYGNIISLFQSKNNLYIDIRSEMGNSYNYCINYADSNQQNIQIGQDSDPLSFSDQQYQTNSWPILIITAPQAVNSADNTKNTIWFTLRVNDNVRPLLFDVNIGMGEGAFNNIYPSDDFGIDGQGGGYKDAWTNAFSYNFPNSSIIPTLAQSTAKNTMKSTALIETATTANNVAYYIKSYYYRRQTSVVPPPAVLKSTKYYHSAFAPIDLPNIGDNSIGYQTVENPNKRLMDEPLQVPGTGGYTHSTTQNVTWNATRVLFYSTKSKELLKSGKTFLPLIDSSVQKLSILNKGSAPVFQDLNIICRKYQKPGEQPFNIIGVNGYDSTQKTDKEYAVFLGITFEELNILKTYINSGFKYIYLQRNEPAPLFNDVTIDINGNPFYEYTILLQGFIGSDATAFITPNTSLLQPILVYSRDNLFFSSPGFSAGETAPDVPNRVEYHTNTSTVDAKKGLIKVNDNIDLCLIAELKPIHFFYNGIRVTQFKTVIANQMENGQICGYSNYPKKPIQPPYPPLTSPIPPPTDYPTVTKNYLGDGVDALFSYENAKHDILTIGKGKAPHLPTDLHYQMIYKNTGLKAVMVYFNNIHYDNNGKPDPANDHALHIQYPDSNSPKIDIVFDYSGSQRHYANPAVAAAIIAILIETKVNVKSGGFSYGDGTCFPSQTHANGAAIDLQYQTTTISQALIEGLIKYGFKERIVGESQKDTLTGYTSHNDVHNNHLHGGKLQINI